MIDPKSKYYDARFEQQPQPWPGLQRYMKPASDSGEEGYVGTGRLVGRKADRKFGIAKVKEAWAGLTGGEVD